MYTTIVISASPLISEYTIHSASVLSNLFENRDWVGNSPRVDDRYYSITIAEDILKFLVVSLELLNPFHLPLGEADADTVQVPGPRPPFFRIYPLYLQHKFRQPDRLLALNDQEVQRLMARSRLRQLEESDSFDKLHDVVGSKLFAYNQ